MVIFFAGPQEYMEAALSASQYCCTRPALRVEEAEAIILVWNGRCPEVEALLNNPRDGRPRYVYRVPCG